MMQVQHSKLRGFGRELRLVAQRARQVWNLVPRQHKLALAAGCSVMAFTAATNTALPLFLGRLVDSVRLGTEGGLSPDALYCAAGVYLGLIAATYLLRECLNVLRRYLVENTCTRIDRDMTVRIVGHLMKVDLTTLTHEKVGTLNGRIARNVAGYVRFLRISFLDFFPAILTGTFALTATLSKQPWLGMVMLGVVPVSLCLTVWQLISQKGIRLSLIRSREAMDGTVVEQLGGLDYVRVANTHPLEVKRVADVAEHRRGKELRHHFEMSLFGSGKAINEGFFHILVLSASVYFAVTGAISIGDILTFSMLFLNVMTPLSEVHRVLDEAHECSLQVGDLLDMLAEPIDRSFEPAQPREPLLDPKVPLVVVENMRVSYRTPDGQRRRALHGISMAIRHGETIGVAGRSGSGKSTWLRALMRLTHPCGGRVLIGGVPLESVSREAIGQLVGYVGQSPFVFAGTVAENIAYGSEGASPDDIRRAAERACIHEEILAMPGGYQAPVSERGQNLSGGQKQRIALARVFLKNPPLLILDEGTSALDNINERRVQRALAAARDDRTVILVAHRLTTLKDADRIFVFEGGRIAEVGPYAELVEAEGVFTELVRCAEEGMLVSADA
jgi:ATP-binding cassette subfamily B protein